MGVASRSCGRKTSFVKTEGRFGGFGNGLAQPAADVPRVLVFVTHKAEATQVARELAEKRVSWRSYVPREFTVF